MLPNLTLTQTYIQENQLAIVEVAAPVPVAEIVMEPESDEVSGLVHVLWTLTSICIQKLSENTRAVVPTTTQYIKATGKEALALLQAAAGVIPVPLLRDAIGVAMKIIEVCEVRGILHMKSTTRFTYDIYLSGGISCPTRGQRVTREGRPSHDRYCG